MPQQYPDENISTAMQRSNIHDSGGTSLANSTMVANSATTFDQLSQTNTTTPLKGPF